VLPSAPYVEVEDGNNRRARDIDVILTGNMRYPPNREAAHRFAKEIVPAIRRTRDVRAFIVGRDAAALGLDESVSIASDVADVFPYLRRARIALVPISTGTGLPTKVLEAAASGAAVVATPEIARKFAAPPIVASTAEEFADVVCRLLDDEQMRYTAARALMSAIDAYSPEVLGARLEAILEAAAERPEEGPAPGAIRAPAP
jgi:glycosyltransferase involved in cell wall biosynthesis